MLGGALEDDLPLEAVQEPDDDLALGGAGLDDDFNDLSLTSLFTTYNVCPWEGLGAGCGRWARERAV